MENVKKLDYDVLKAIFDGTSEREKSWDYCYKYFYTHRGDKLDIELGCLYLWSYLGSYGMLRGSSWLLKSANYRSLQDVVTFVKNNGADYFPKNEEIELIDVQKLEDLYKELATIVSKIRNTLLNTPNDEDNKYTPTITLITKIMLGVWGCCPAYDSVFRKYAQQFIEGSGHNTFKFPKESLEYISALVKENHPTISKLQEERYIDNGSEKIPYPAARIIDIYVWSQGTKKKQQI